MERCRRDLAPYYRQVQVWRCGDGIRLEAKQELRLACHDACLRARLWATAAVTAPPTQWGCDAHVGPKTSVPSARCGAKPVLLGGTNIRRDARVATRIARSAVIKDGRENFLTFGRRKTPAVNCSLTDTAQFKINQ